MGVLLSLHPNCADSRSESRGGLRGAASSPSVGIAIGKVDEWLVQAKPGDRLEYHRGYLAMDRGVGSRLGEEAGRELDRVATALMAMAEAGDVHAQYSLGWMYHNGYGLSIDDERAQEWWGKAANQNDADSQYALATSLMDRPKKERDTAKALEWLGKAEARSA